MVSGRATHIVKCRDPVCTAAYHRSVNKLADWMQKEQTCNELAFLIKRCLLGSGDIPMLSLSLTTCNMALATPHLLLPKICSAILILLKDGFVYSFKNYDRRTSTCAASCLGKHSAAHWCKNFINNLLQIRHLHSIVHNNTKHFFDEDSRTRSLQ